MRVEVYDFPSHSKLAKRAYGVKVNGALIGLVEQYPDESWHMGGGRARKLGWITYSSQEEVVSIMVAAEMDKEVEEQTEMVETEIFLEKNGVTVWQAYDGDRRLQHLFSLSQEAAEGGPGVVFDVRELKGYNGMIKKGKGDDEAAKAAIEAAIERGEMGEQGLGFN